MEFNAKIVKFECDYTIKYLLLLHITFKHIKSTDDNFVKDYQKE